MSKSLALIDSSIIQAYQDSARAEGGAEEEAIGRSLGGLRTKIQVATNAKGLPVAIEVSASQCADVSMAPTVIKAFPKVATWWQTKAMMPTP